MMRFMTIAALAGMVAVAVADDEKNPVMEAIDLPVVAQKLRESGADPKDVFIALAAHRDAGLAPADASQTMKAAYKGVREHGTIDKFGEFVREQVTSGKRGQELADSILGEHASRGKGKPEGKAKDKAKDDKGKGKSEGKGKSDEKGKGKADEKGKSEGKAKADEKGKGKADEKGKKSDEKGSKAKKGGE